MFELLDWINQIRADLPALEKRALEDAEEDNDSVMWHDEAHGWFDAMDGDD